MAISCEIYKHLLNPETPRPSQDQLRALGEHERYCETHARETTVACEVIDEMLRGSEPINRVAETVLREHRWECPRHKKDGRLTTLLGDIRNAGTTSQ